jgi:glycosyltransferase involved in cell wall biosynthesis
MDGAVHVHRLRGTLQRAEKLFSESERRHAPPFPDPELMLALRRLVQHEQPDIVHAHNWLVDSFLPLKRPGGPGLVLSLHDYSFVCANKNFMHNDEICDGPGLACFPCAKKRYGTAVGAVTTIGKFGSRFVARHTVDCFIAVSHAVARYNGLSGLPHEVIPNFVPDNVAVLGPDFDQRLDQLPPEYILFVGDLMRLKGIDVLLKAYRLLPDAPPLVMIGRRLSDTPTEFPPNVRVFEPWPHDTIMHAWRRCLFGVLPSTGPEACATVIMEAMACGKPMVASDIGGMPDLITTGENGLLVPPGDSVTLATAMQLLLANGGMRAAMGQNCLSRVEDLKASAVVSRIEQVYQSVIDKRGIRSAA